MPKILVATSFSNAAEHILDIAIDMAKALQASIYMVHVELPNENIDNNEPEDIEHDYAEALDHLQTLAHKVRESGIETHAILMTGVTPIAVINEAENIQAKLIVVGRSVADIKHAFLGNISQQIIRDAKIPVLVVPPVQD